MLNVSCSRTQRCSAGEAWTHGHSVSSQALYHDSQSQFLNPENKLLYEMKSKCSCYSFAITFLSSILAKWVNDKAVEMTFQGLVFVARTDFVYSKTSKIRTPIFRNTG